MKRLRASVTCVAAVVAAASFALAQSPLQPVQYVNPSSTLQEIQQALDNGGTVFFQYGEYNQILSSTPDLPPSPANPAKSLAIGRNGKDVNVIGLLSPNGQRPRINGGNVVFRVGSVGKAVNFRIENLEISTRVWPRRACSIRESESLWQMRWGARASSTTARLP